MTLFFLLLLSDVTDARITGSRFKRPMENKIFFEAVQTSDPMVIQCNASNIHGYVFADVYLNVLCKSLNVLYKFVCNLVCVQMCFWVDGWLVFVSNPKPESFIEQGYSLCISLLLSCGNKKIGKEAEYLANIIKTIT